MHPVTFQELSAAMTEAIEGDPTIQKKLNAIVHFQVEEEKEEKDRRQTFPVIELNAKYDPARTRNDFTTTATPSASKPDVVVWASLSVLQELLEQKLTPQRAFMKGKIKIRGKLGLAMKLELILKSTRKVLISQRKSKL
jgi:putative sterol carrier protein